MLRRFFLFVMLCAGFGAQANAEITATTLVPFGVEYIGSAAQIDLPSGAYYGSVDMPGNYSNPHKVLVHFSTPRPSNIAANNSRHTVAMDVNFFGDFLSIGGSHLVLATRHSGITYTGPGSNRAGAIIAGELWGAGVVGVEEIEITSSYTNVLHQLMPKLVPGRWYRISVETIALSGGVALEARVWDVTAGNILIYSMPTTWSAYGGNYNLANEKVSLASVSSATGGFIFSNLKSYWSNGSEWVANP